MPIRALVATLIFLTFSGFDGQGEESSYCTMAHHLVKQQVHAAWGPGVAVEQASRTCQMSGEGTIRKVRRAYTTVLSRRNRTPPVEYEVTIKKTGADSYRLCAWRNPIDTPEETLGVC